MSLTTAFPCCVVLGDISIFVQTVSIMKSFMKFISVKLLINSLLVICQLESNSYIALL